MTDSLPQFEITDTAGQTVHVNGPAVSTVAFNVPASPVGIIAELAIINDPGNPATHIIEVSFDGGTKYMPIFRGGTLTWTPKGNLQQLTFKASHVGLNFFALLNLDPP